MPINPDAVGYAAEPVERSWTSKDALLYALGVGAGSPDPAQELPFTTENSEGVEQLVLPTFPVIVGFGGGAHRAIGTYDPAMLVHGEQAVELHAPVPVEGRIRVIERVTGIYDKGSGAVATFAAESTDVASGDPLFTLRSAVFIRGEGGFGGDRGPAGPRNRPPERVPDLVVTYATRPDQALLYRLSGDRNQLHSDPAFAARAGFPRPILHGLCTYGFTGRALLHGLCGSAPARFRSLEGRFTRPVFPGDELVVKAWCTGDGTAVFRTENGNGDVVIDEGCLGFEVEP
jgi:acyl dehydratase